MKFGKSRAAPGRGRVTKVEGLRGAVMALDLALGQHVRQRFVGRDGAHAEFRRQVQRDLLLAAGILLAAGEILDAGGIDAVFVLQNAALPHRRGELIFRNADALADQILGLGDAALGGDEDAVMAEEPRGKDRDRDEGRIVAGRATWCRS